MTREREKEKRRDDASNLKATLHVTPKSRYVRLQYCGQESSQQRNSLSKGKNGSVYIEQLTADRATRTRGSLGNAVRNKCGADSFVDTLFPVNEIDSSCYLYPQVILRMQEDVEICKSSGVERSRPTCPRHKISGCNVVNVIVRTVNRGTIRADPGTLRVRQLHRGIAR